MALKATLFAGIAARYTGSPDQGVAEYNMPKPADVAIDHGVGDNQADCLWSDSRTLASNTSEDLDLRGVLKDIFGANADLVEVVAIFIRSRDANTTNLTVGNGTNPFVGGFGAGTQSWIIPPGGQFMVSAPKAGWAVTAGSADILKIANAAGASATYDIQVIGRLS